MFWMKMDVPMIGGTLMKGARKTVDSISKGTPRVEVTRRHGTSWSWLPGVLLGLTVGALAGLMFAPQKGSQTRTAVQSRMGEYTKDLPDRTNSMMGMARTIGERMASTFSTSERKPTRRRASTTRKTRKPKTTTIEPGSMA